MEILLRLDYKNLKDVLNGIESFNLILQEPEHSNSDIRKLLGLIRGMFEEYVALDDYRLDIEEKNIPITLREKMVFDNFVQTYKSNLEKYENLC